jgi:hypothetical protein
MKRYDIDMDWIIGIVMKMRYILFMRFYVINFVFCFNNISIDGIEIISSILDRCDRNLTIKCDKIKNRDQYT